jgi:hypothetical protein
MSEARYSYREVGSSSSIGVWGASETELRKAFEHYLQHSEYRPLFDVRRLTAAETETYEKRENPT